VKKFYIIVIDSGWPKVAHEVLEKSIKQLKHHFEAHKLILFTQEEAQDFLQDNPDEIGKDPIIIITDIDPRKSKKAMSFDGIRIDLGKIHERTEVIKQLEEICRLIKHDKFIADISWEERKRVAQSFFKSVGDIFVKCLEFMI
jgi:hypothetical protein